MSPVFEILESVLALVLVGRGGGIGAFYSISVKAEKDRQKPPRTARGLRTTLDLR